MKRSTNPAAVSGARTRCNEILEILEGRLDRRLERDRGLTLRGLEDGRRRPYAVDGIAGGLGGDLVPELLQRGGGLLDGAVLGLRHPDGADLFAQIVLVEREVVGELGELGARDEAEPGAKPERQCNDNGHRSRARHAAQPQHPDRRREHEAQQRGEGKWNENVTGKVERGDGDRGADGNRRGLHAAARRSLERTLSIEERLHRSLGCPARKSARISTP